AVQININDGFSAGNLSPRKPMLEVKDLLEGVPADIDVSERGKVAYRCRFTPFRNADQRPLIISIDSARNRCDVSPQKARGGN
ncbi:MAG: hypothetical protein NTV34_18935, partial [Proteobacteria bacterium]|nr:hypothetical protein [Pseudomonadota bacterium]